MLDSQQFEGLAPEQVKVSALMPHREYEHGPGFTRDMNGRQYAPRHSPEEWNSLVSDIRENGIREPLHLDYDPKSHTASLGEGNSRLQAASEAGLKTVPVLGHRSGAVADRASYRLPGRPSYEGHFPADFRVSGVLPKDYLG